MENKITKVLKRNAIHAYKVFNKNWTCFDYQYVVGRTYMHLGEHIGLCDEGFHACLSLSDCFNYYPFAPSEIKVAEVSVWGDVQFSSEDSKLCSSRIRIDRELDLGTVLKLCNAGYRNTGIMNSGNDNSGHGNTGCKNDGSYNSGHQNSGDRNTGDGNSGIYNTGDGNSGGGNTGDYNTGGHNTGKRNRGNRNNGDMNSGNWNTGYYNTGNSNSGDNNSGNWNSGERNSGSSNCGNWNSGSWNSGWFNTKSQEYSFMFNRLVKKSAIEQAPYIPFLYFALTEWVPITDMSPEERLAHPECDVTGGYLKTYSYKEAFRKSFEQAKKQVGWEQQLKDLKSLPNFDAQIFEEISGIRKEELV